MTTYVLRNGRMVDKETGAPMNSGPYEPAAPMVVPDTPGYASPIDGKWIEGRRARRYDLEKNDCVEWEPSLSPTKGRFKNPRFAKKHGLPLMESEQ